MSLSEVPLPHNPETKTDKQPIQQKWWKESTIYQVYPASFKDSKGVGHGDIPGITSELDYIKNLGADILWSSPLLKSPQVDMGYDISDYKDIYAEYGTMADHDALIKGLHDRGMKYILDLVVNHTSDQHEWFKQSRSSKDNPFRDWYYWRPAKKDDDGNRKPPNNWGSAFSGSAWTWDEDTQEYYLHLFAKGQPDLNWENPKVVEAVHDIIRFWLERGVDGFRMDVINFISKTPGLPDATKGDENKGGYQSGIEHYACGPRLHEFLKGMGDILAEYDAFSVGEMPGVTEPEDIRKAVGQDRGELGMAFQFEIVDMQSKGGKWEHQDWYPTELKRIITKWQGFMLENAGWNALYMENHDQSRTVSRYCSDEPHLRTISAKLCAAHLALQSGTLFIYQGQELAQKNFPEEWGMEYYKDIECLNHWETVLRDYPNDKERQARYRKQYRLIGRDNARTPMQWTAGEWAGFMPEGTTGVEPWMAIHPDYKEWNAETAVKDQNSAYVYWQSLLKLRGDHKAIFVYGDFQMLDLEHEEVVAYVRTAAEDSVSKPGEKKQAVVVGNFGGEDKEGGAAGFWWKIPGECKDLLVKDGALREEAVLASLGNYEGGREVKVEGAEAYLKLRPFETIVAMV